MRIKPITLFTVGNTVIVTPTVEDQVQVEGSAELYVHLAGWKLTF